MKQFSLEEFKKNPNRKVVTRCGLPVRVICTDKKGEYPVVALVRKSDNNEEANSFKENGLYIEGHEVNIDLFFAPEKLDGWVNIYKENEDYIRTGASVFKTKEEAMKHINSRYYISTIHIEWEEERL